MPINYMLIVVNYNEIIVKLSLKYKFIKKKNT